MHKQYTDYVRVALILSRETDLRDAPIYLTQYHNTNDLKKSRLQATYTTRSDGIMLGWWRRPRICSPGCQGGKYMTWLLM